MMLIQGNHISRTPLSGGVLSDVFKRFLNHFRSVSALGVNGSHEPDGIICRASKFPLTSGKLVSFEMNGHQPGEDKTATFKRASDER